MTTVVRHRFAIPKHVVWDEKLSYFVLRDFELIGCDVVGPAVLYPLPDGQFWSESNNFDAPGGLQSLVIVGQPGTPCGAGVVVVDNVVLRGCRVKGVSILSAGDGDDSLLVKIGRDLLGNA